MFKKRGTLLNINYSLESIYKENPANLNGSYGSYQNNHGQMQHYTNGAVGNSVHIQQSLDGVNGSVGNSMHFQQNPNGFLSQNENARNQFVTHGNGIQEIRPTGSQQPSFLGYRYQQSPSGYHGEYVGGNQQSANGHYGGNIGVSQPNQNGYGRETTVHYPQKSSNDFDYIAGQIVQRSNQFQNNSFSSQVPGGSSGTSVETAEDNQFRGTVEELEGLCKEGKVKEAIEVLTLLEKQQIVVDLPLYLQLIQACGEAKALQEAKAVHEHLVQSGMPLKVSIYNKVLDMYGKCGSMDDAYALFKSMPGRNLTSWDTMITWLAKNGLGEDALDLFMEFKKAGLKPDAQMFIGVFSACGVEGDITEGLLHFESMSKEYGILPSMEHYVSIVHMMGSAGYIDEALEFIEKMPAEPTVDVWETLMNLCRVHGDVELGDRCAELVELMDPSRLSEQSKQGLIPAKASDLAREKEKKKMAGQNLLEVRSRVHEYRAGDTSHPEKEKIYAQLRRLKEQMKEAGYIPETRFVLHDIDQEGKEEALLAHSERLAASYGLLSSPVRSPIRVIKNLRVCGDCHSALKIISKLTGRELIMRDAKRFHHFKDGVCSCRDYW
ncbi:Pentatricopeptide repeat [Dillenia turbinata]|uniref:Pentatricopeptide repeat n=1 Tax=Dillenia turbinata TaxID=194707 RepID=A0AAN8V9K6_9MAGN